MKRLILILLISLLFFPIAASPEFWFGASFIADRNMLSPEIADKFPAMDEEVSQIRSLGISVDLAFFPWNQVRIGPVLSSDTLLPIGYTGTSGDNQGYITYDFDSSPTRSAWSSPLVIITHGTGLPKSILRMNRPLWSLSMPLIVVSWQRLESYPVLTICISGSASTSHIALSIGSGGFIIG